ncbi:MAG: PorT family protein [Prevotella sp.]|nr:PorT family protein [Prevotella sp.]
MKKKIIFFAICAILAAPVNAQSYFDHLEVKTRVGYNIGGTAPIGMPATIRSIEAFRLTPSFMVGFDVAMPLKQKWGLQAGLHFENKAMNAEVTTKGYRMEVVKGDSKLDGLFTGHVKQEVTEWMLTLPIEATYALGKVTLKAGPYFSLLLHKDFSGIASNGYLRQGDPTGPRINMGNKDGEWATYDFSDEMRPLQMGVSVGADWQVHRKIGLSADLNWGLTGIFKSDFKTVEQTLFPIYGTIGIFNKF